MKFDLKLLYFLDLTSMTDFSLDSKGSEKILFIKYLYFLWNTFLQINCNDVQPCMKLWKNVHNTQ